MEVFEWGIVHFIIVIRHFIGRQDTMLVCEFPIHLAKVFTLLRGDLSSLTLSFFPALVEKKDIRQGRRLS